jgi:HKD family nuclease
MKISKKDDWMQRYIIDNLKEYIPSIENEDGTQYSIYIVSCYMNTETLFFLIKSWIELLKDKEFLKYIKEINIYFDRSGITCPVTEEPEELKKFRSHGTVNIRIPKSSLFHPKAYALISENSTEGIIFFGSANLTKNGMQGGNIELISHTTDEDQIKDFKDQISDIDCESIESFEKVREQLLPLQEKLTLIQKAGLFHSFEYQIG